MPKPIMAAAAQDAPVLLADIGGTNARFSLLGPAGQRGPIRILPVAEHSGPAEAAARFLQDEARPPNSAVFGVAGPVSEQRCTLTNSGWILDGAALRSALGLAHVRIVNDFEALSHALPLLDPASDLVSLGGGAPVPRRPMALIGPGTGLGVGCLVPAPEGWVALASEGGHASLAACNEREAAVVAVLRDRFGAHVSCERALSGPGLENLYEAVARLDGSGAPPRDAASVTAFALAGNCPTSTATLDMFCALLGSTAGDLALIYGASGGVFVAGGIPPRIVDVLLRSAFRDRFEAKGRFRSYLEHVPTWIIRDPDAAAFTGLAALSRTPP
jgi:glucokinase